MLPHASSWMYQSLVDCGSALSVYGAGYHREIPRGCVGICSSLYNAHSTVILQTNRQCEARRVREIHGSRCLSTSPWHPHKAMRPGRTS